MKALLRTESPEWVDEELHELGEIFMPEGDPDEDCTWEEYNEWIYVHASDRLKAYIDAVKAAGPEPL